jgi:transcriptional regulator with XRE-family HTH domain
MRKYSWQYSIDVVGTKLNMKQIRKEKKIKMTDLEKYFGFSKQALYRWEDVNKKTLPALENLYALAGLYEVTLDSLLVRAAS